MVGERKKSAAQLFSERQAHWVGQGLSGRDVFLALAKDHELPSFFTESDLAEISGLTTHAMKQRRVRAMDPAFVRFSVRCVRYTREAVCIWLADMFHRNEAA